MTAAVKPVYNNYIWDPKIMVVLFRWSLFRGHLRNRNSEWDPKMVVVVSRWSLFGGKSGFTVVEK